MSLGLANTRICNAMTPVSVASGAVTPIVIDTKGFREAMFIAFLGANATAGPTVLNVTEGDTTTPATAITATDLSGATWVTAQNIMVWNLNLRKRKRYLRCNCTVGGTTVMGVLCILGKPEVSVSGGVARLLVAAATQGGATEEASL